MSENSELVGQKIRIFKRGNQWHCTIQHRRTQRRKSLGTTNKKEARRLALEIENELLNGARSSHTPSRECPSIDQVLTAFQRYWEVEELSQKTVSKYSVVADRIAILADELGRDDLLGIDAEFVDRYRHRRRSVDKSAPATISNEVTIIRQIVKLAVTRWKLNENPLAGYRMKEPKPTPQPCWTPSEVEQILVSAKDDEFRLLLTVFADTGARFGEIQWLSWSDVDAESNVLHIRPKDGWKPKTGNIRAIPMSPRVRDSLTQRRPLNKWVFTAPPSSKYPIGDHQISERRSLRKLKRILKQLGLKGHIHTFRHSFVSKALISGIPEAVVREWVGQIDKDILRLYTHIACQQSQSAMRRMFKSEIEKGEQE